jgi:hypothetical protein
MEKEKRKPFAPGALGKSNPIPLDYVKLVSEVFRTNFDAGLKAYDQLHSRRSAFHVSGAIYVDEIVLAVTLSSEDQIVATTVYGSAEYDPVASSPTAQDLLAACVDAIGTVYAGLLDPLDKAQLEALGTESLSALDKVPFDWTKVEVERFRIHVKLDKSNPQLESLADQWLDKNDPGRREREQREHEETEALFVTGPKKGETRH